MYIRFTSTPARHWTCNFNALTYRRRFVEKITGSTFFWDEIFDRGRNERIELHVLDIWNILKLLKSRRFKSPALFHTCSVHDWVFFVHLQQSVIQTNDSIVRKAREHNVVHSVCNSLTTIYVWNNGFSWYVYRKRPWITRMGINNCFFFNSFP